MPKPIDITGMKWGRLTAISKTDDGKWMFLCDCGNQKAVRSADVKNGKTLSCGCRLREATIKRNQECGTHHMSTTPTGISWQAMISRCFNSKQRTFAAYGAVGILPCEFIRCSPLNLVALIGERQPGTTLDRIKNDKGYWCGSCAQCVMNGWPMNVRWATIAVQNRNTSQNVNLTINGETKCLTDWAATIGINASVIRLRIKRGWPLHKLLSPLGTRNKSRFGPLGQPKPLIEEHPWHT